MIRIEITPHYKPLLEATNLSQYQEIMSELSGHMIDSDSARDIQRLQLGGDNYYLKRTKKEKLSSALESYLLARAPHAKPYKEMLQIRYLNEQKFRTAEVVAAGEELKFGIPVGGFILTREVPGEELTKVLQQSEKPERTQLLQRYGQLLAQLHSQGFFLSVRLKDVFYVRNRSDDTALVLIDRETRNPKPKSFSPSLAIASLHTSLRRQIRAGDAPGTKDLRTIARAYCSEVSELWAIAPPGLFRAVRDQFEK